MADLNAIAFLFFLLVLQSRTCTSDFFSPVLSPIMDEVCKAVECGKGKCQPSQNSSLPPSYYCECDPGWKRTLDQRYDHLKFLPCVVPNCTLNNACAATPSPVSEKSAKANDSILGICNWVYCGGGSCNQTSAFTHNCQCSAGYYNLINISAFPCFRECEIGMDCAALGIPLPNKTSNTTPALSENIAGSNPVHSFVWLSVMSITLLHWAGMI